jgi:hypothetical protein
LDITAAHHGIKEGLGAAHCIASPRAAHHSERSVTPASTCAAIFGSKFGSPSPSCHRRDISYSHIGSCRIMLASSSSQCDKRPFDPRTRWERGTGSSSAAAGADAPSRRRCSDMLHPTTTHRVAQPSP